MAVYDNGGPEIVTWSTYYRMVGLSLLYSLRFRGRAGVGPAGRQAETSVRRTTPGTSTYWNPIPIRVGNMQQHARHALSWEDKSGRNDSCLGAICTQSSTLRAPHGDRTEDLTRAVLLALSSPSRLTNSNQACCWSSTFILTRLSRLTSDAVPALPSRD